ncbi:glycosyltransferase family 1 protein [Stutzerimonas urumqiensis]|uniref:glycosyltransferase n=1 Tax=Stutzerimonas urumqiensis TaxID=638269 RepID=UPI003DA4DD18
MTRFAVIAPPFHSHLRALEALSQALIDRGHEVVFVQQADVGMALRLSAAGFVAVGAGSHPPGSMAAIVARAARPGGPRGLGRVIADMAASTDMLCREVPGVLSALAVDAVIADQMEPAGALVAEHLDLPYVSVACALPFNREPLVPLPVMPWAYRATPWAEQLNLHSTRVYDRLMRPHGAVIARHCERLGVPARAHLGECLSPLLQLSQTTAAFDFPRAALPAHFHHVGPLRLPVEAEPPLEVSIDPRRPLVFASLGTLQGDRLGLFRRIVHACRRLDAQVLVAHCGGLDRAGVRRLERDGADWVTDFAPQRAVLARAQAVVTHAGLNTVLDAFAAGVPMLALPIAFDQPGVAARVAYQGAGLRLGHRWASQRRIGQALRRLLDDPTFASRAASVGDSVRQAGGAARAAMLTERAVSAGEPVTEAEHAA